MRPTTKLEKEVAWLSSHILPPSMEQIEDAHQHMFTPKAYYTKKHGYECLECGHQFHYAFQDSGTTVLCPNCGKHVKPEYTRKHRETEIKFYMILQTLYHGDKEFIVQRLFEVRKYMAKGNAATYSWWDIAEYYTVAGKQVCLGLPLTMFGRWNYNADLTIKKYRGASYYGGSFNSYKLEPHYMYTESVAPMLQRNGFRGDYEGFFPQCFVNLLMTNPNFEKLYKIGGSRFIAYYENDIINQVKLVNRNNYRISDVNIWIDTIDVLRRLHMDDRNPKHICPDNLFQWHNQLLDRWNRIQERQRIAQERERNRERILREKEQCEKYIEHIARFLQLNISDELINILPIPTVEAVADEGAAMRHCVFSMGYYKRPDVLLLSARDKQGHRVETIEVNLNTYQVAQSRGVCNQNTEHHERILALMKKGMRQIRKLNTKKINIKAA